MIVIVDYGMGNLRSVSKALESLKAEVKISSRPEDIASASKLILPGVGAFPAAMDELSQRQLIDPIKQFIEAGKPYLGICLGLQLLFEQSDEGSAKGLSILPGRVRRFGSSGPNSLKVPHMGWNQILKPRSLDEKPRDRCPLLKDIDNESFFYFVHSYYVDPVDQSIVALESEYGIRFTSMVWHDNIYATQFHPEKSQGAGLHFLENFIKQ